MRPRQPHVPVGLNPDRTQLRLVLLPPPTGTPSAVLLLCARPGIHNRLLRSYGILVGGAICTSSPHTACPTNAHYEHERDLLLHLTLDHDDADALIHDDDAHTTTMLTRRRCSHDDDAHTTTMPTRR
ncbi:hypothetical protein BDZ89DRAFT_1066186 [Hymenopellis radicata]|nr:hypothetical protein BDZ89DRAFT_1066186 [Hymenopellis radicata]